MLGEKGFRGYEKQKQELEVAKAKIEGLENCPFCNYAQILADTEREFNCQECERVSCRQCKQDTHLPFSCDEVKRKDLVLMAKHQVEEAMTAALLRTCPSCKASFFKTEGCNKMACQCGQYMCYVCRQPIKDYTHFDAAPASAQATTSSNFCLL